MFHSFNGIVYSNENKQATTSQNNMDESHKIKLNEKKAEPKNIYYVTSFI